MKASLSLLLAVSCNIAFSARVAAQNPYPTGCWDFTTETVYCNDVDSGRGSCHGSLIGVIVSPVDDDGLFSGQFESLVCTGGTINSPGTNSPTCPTCPSQSNYVTEVYNPGCLGSGAEAAEIAAATVRPLCALLKSAI